MGHDAGSNVSDASSRRGRPEAVLDWRSLWTVQLMNGVRLHACVDEKGHFEY